MRRRQIWLLLCACLGGCSSPRPTAAPNEVPYDPLPAWFPVQLQPPQVIAGFSLQQAQPEPLDLHSGLALVYVQAPPQQIKVDLLIRFGGAFVDGYQAIQQSWPLERAFVAQDLDKAGLTPLQTLGERARSIRAASGRPDRQGRTRQLRLEDAASAQWVLSHDLYFVDPYLISMRATLPVADAADAANGNSATEAALAALDDFAAAFIAVLEPAESVLCDTRVQVLKVREGLSNVSSNGRVIFISTQTDHVDESTVAELRRAATQQRARNLCSGPAADFSELEAQMRRRARVR